VNQPRGPVRFLEVDRRDAEKDTDLICPHCGGKINTE
jgi:DNA-directed RNA polymerase subunit RPC12/RpoP